MAKKPLILKGTEPRGFPSWPEANLPQSTGRIDSRIQCQSTIEIYLAREASIDSFLRHYNENQILLESQPQICAIGADGGQPHNLAAILAAKAARPGVPQVACFDTAFHQTQPPIATRFAISQAYFVEGIRRYGFHGLSYEYVARTLARTDPKLAAGRVITAHLGNGASLCAMDGGRSIDTTMGFTALDGLMMGTRCGAIDPGVILYLQQQKGMSPEEVQHLLYEESGLLGVSGLSGDMRNLIECPDEPARQAVELFVYRVAREAGALASSLGGLDGLVFTAGIGENSPAVRALVCARLAWLGVEIDAKANAAGAPTISTAASRVTVRVIPTDEERMIAMHTLEIVGQNRELEAA